VIAETFKTATVLWREASRFLFALGTVLLLGFIALAVGTRIDPDTFGDVSHKWAAILLVSSLALLVFGAFKYHAERSIRTVELVPTGHECSAHSLMAATSHKLQAVSKYSICLTRPSG
jgi:hypothetical protein